MQLYKEIEQNKEFLGKLYREGLIGGNVFLIIDTYQYYELKRLHNSISDSIFLTGETFGVSRATVYRRLNKFKNLFQKDF